MRVVKLFGFLVIIVAGVFVYFFVKDYMNDKKEKERIAEIKKGWHVEIIYDEPVNVRKEADSYAAVLGQVEKGEVFKALEVVQRSDSAFNWYKIEYKSGMTAFIANPKSIKADKFLKDVNNEEDLFVPVISYDKSVYVVDSIDKINYNHLTLWDDKEGFSVTHKVCHEVKESSGINQYWILYTITDKVGKSSSKLQKIEFRIKPEESKVVDFYKYCKE